MDDQKDLTKTKKYKDMNPFLILLHEKQWVLHLTFAASILTIALLLAWMVSVIYIHDHPTPRASVGTFGFWSSILGTPVLILATSSFLFDLLSIYAENAFEKVDKVIARGSEELNYVENELAANDKSGLVPLLRYSRVQLEAYYRIGLTQTQRSFRYSIIAMWIGFAVIVGGLVVRIFDLSKFGLIAPDSNFSTLIIASGAIIEVISALFLWVYRNSVKQLTYFYNRQIYNHSVLMSQRIAETMTSADDVKKIIIEKLLDRSWALDLDALPSGKSLLSSRQNTH